MDSTAWGSFGGSPGGGLGGSAPPEIERFWPSCAHSACFLGPTRPSLPHGATASPMTDLAPASPSTLAHASRVAQVVSTSSTSKTRSLSTSPPGARGKSATHRVASVAALAPGQGVLEPLGTRPLRAAVTSLASEGLGPDLADVSPASSRSDSRHSAGKYAHQSIDRIRGPTPRTARRSFAAVQAGAHSGSLTD